MQTQPIDITQHNYDAGKYIDDPAVAVKHAVDLAMRYGGQAGLDFAEAYEKTLGVDYDDIAAACTVVADDEYRNPFEEDEWLSHTLHPANGLDWDSHACIYHEHRRRIIDVENDDSAWYRAQGCSKQVAREKAAQAKRRIIKRIAEIYADGVEYFGVTCEYNGFGDSIWGIDDMETAEWYRDEIIGQVVYQMQQAGWTVYNQPEAKPIQRHVPGNVNAFNLG